MSQKKFFISLNLKFRHRSVLITLSLLIIIAFMSCGRPILSALDKNSKIYLSQNRILPKAKKEISDTLQIYSNKTKKDLKNKYMSYEKVNGEDIMSLSLADINVVAKSKNVPERSGTIKLDFKVTVPASLINRKWQVQLTPFADKNGKKIIFDKIFISGADFLRQQKKGYQMYQNFLASIIPDSAYMQTFFDEKGYNKALHSIEGQFYDSWKKGLLSQSRFIDWRNAQNKRYMLFNGKMERNRASINPNDWRCHLPAFKMKREIDKVPDSWSCFLSPQHKLEQKSITSEDSIEISKKYFNYKRMMENERKKSILEDKFKEYIRFPREACRLDTIISNIANGDNSFEYYYSQKIDADENIKKIDVAISGEVIALDGSSCKLPKSDTLTYYISSMLQFLDRSVHYKQIIVSRHSQANISALVRFKAGSSNFDERIGKNKDEVDKVLETLHKLTFTGELVLDSVNMKATSSPEGDSQVNLRLSSERAKALKDYLLKKSKDDGIKLFRPMAVGEDWGKLTNLIRCDTVIDHPAKILNLISSIDDSNARELALRKLADYHYIRNDLYPKLRAVNFQFYLHRREMIKDTIHTTVIDTVYMDAIKFMDNRQYKAALNILDKYSDYNTAVCLMSLGYDNRAITILESLPRNSNSLYLLSILYAREQRTSQAIELFHEACILDNSKWYRGRLDPEINKIIQNYNLNYE